MNREEALEHFYKNVVNDESFKCLEKTYQLLKDNKYEYINVFLENYIKLYEKIVNVQKDNDKKICFIHTHLLRTGVFLKDYVIDISAYDENWYLDKEPVSVEFTFKDFFIYLDELEVLYKNKVKPYVRKLTVADALVAKQKELNKYLHFFTHITHKAVAQSIKTDVFKQVKTGDFLNFYTGEYKDNFTLAYKLDYTQQDEQKLRDFFENTENMERSKQKLMFLDFRALNFETVDMRFYNFSYANFENAILTGSDISGCSLAGTHFENAAMQHLTMKGCLIQDASFENANLANANLQGCIGNLDTLTMEKPFVIGLYGVSFKCADLTRTDFTQCHLADADFRDAVFYETNFTNTHLENALFNKNAIDKINLTAEQKNSIKIIEL